MPDKTADEKAIELATANETFWKHIRSTPSAPLTHAEFDVYCRAAQDQLDREKK